MKKLINKIVQAGCVFLMSTALYEQAFASEAETATTNSAENSTETQETILTEPKPRQGYYFGLGAYGAAVGFNHYREGWLPAFWGGGGALHVGQGLNDKLAIGLDLAASSGANTDRTLLFGNVSLELKWSFYKNLFIRPSIGFGFADFYRHDSEQKQILGTISGSYTVTFGADLFVKKKKLGSGGMSISPIMWINGRNGINLHSIAGGIGIELTAWTGLPKNQLVLPVDKAF